MLDKIGTTLVGTLGYFIAVAAAMFVLTKYKGVSLQAVCCDDAVKENKWITPSKTIIMAIIFVLYNVLITTLHPVVEGEGDRWNYTCNFNGVRPSTPGVNVVMKFIHLFSDDVRIFFYFTTLVVILGIMLAMHISKEATPEAFLLLCCTQYILSFYAMLKQAYAAAFALICISLAIRRESWKDDVLAVLAIVLAITCHPSAYFLIPLFVVIRMKKTKRRVQLIFIGLVVIVIGLEPLVLGLASVIKPFVPSLSVKIYEYFGSMLKFNTSGDMTFVKGIPFYVITAWGCLNRNQLKDKIEHYDTYLLLSGITSFIYVITIYNSWMYRLAYYLYFTVSVFFVQMLRHMENRGNKVLLATAVYGVMATFTLRYIVMIFFRYGGF